MQKAQFVECYITDTYVERGGIYEVEKIDDFGVHAITRSGVCYLFDRDMQGNEWDFIDDATIVELNYE